jgi:sigma-E factor negative regulatory protein RseC
MKEDFQVVEITHDSMTIKSNREVGCNSCSSKNACGTGVLSGLFSSFSLFKKPLQNGVKAGDMITLEISSKELFLRASQLYLMPLLALFVGASISNIFYPANDVIQTLVGLSSLSAVLLFLRHSLK